MVMCCVCKRERSLSGVWPGLNPKKSDQAGESFNLLLCADLGQICRYHLCLGSNTAGHVERLPVSCS